jgi:hypothetical protein
MGRGGGGGRGEEEEEVTVWVVHLSRVPDDDRMTDEAWS